MSEMEALKSENESLKNVIKNLSAEKAVIDEMLGAQLKSSFDAKKIAKLLEQMVGEQATKIAGLEKQVKDLTPVVHEAGAEYDAA